MNCKKFPHGTLSGNGWSCSLKHLLLPLLLIAGLTSPSFGQSIPELLGKMALLEEPGVMKSLNLREAEQEQILEWIDRRVEAGTELLLDVNDLPPAERDQRLAPFRRETESLGQNLLSEEQWEKLNSIGIRSQGMESLADPKLAEELELSEQQRTARDQILAEKQQALIGADSLEKEKVEATAERRLRDLLSDNQWTKWQTLAGEDETADAEPAAEMTEDSTEAANPPAEESTQQQVAAEETSESMPAEEDDVWNLLDEFADETPATTMQPVQPAEPPGEMKIRFNFRYQPWAEVLDWFADIADLSLVMESPPQGTFNYSDSRSYTASEAIDLLNSVLLTKGFTLVRKERLLILVNLEDTLPPNLVNEIPLTELDDRGEYELVKVRFPLNKMSATEAETEIQPLIGPQGSIVKLEKARQIVVTETAGRLRTIRDVIDRIENPNGEGTIQIFTLENALLDDAMIAIRQLMDIPLDLTNTTDGSLRLALDPIGNRFLASGTPDKIRQLKEILEVVDVPSTGSDTFGAGTALETPQLDIYPVGSADSESALLVLQTLLSGSLTARLSIDPKTGNLIALATPTEHATINATLKQMQQEAREVEVLQLRVIDPQIAVLSITKLFGATGDGDVRAPTIDADPLSRQLLVRGSQSQIAQIRQLLEKMGEDFSEEANTGSRVRMLSVSERQLAPVLQQLQTLWPTMRENKIRIVRPGESLQNPNNPAINQIPPEVLRQLFEGPSTPSPNSQRQRYEEDEYYQEREPKAQPEREPPQAYYQPQQRSQYASLVKEDSAESQNYFLPVQQRVSPSPADSNSSASPAPIFIMPDANGIIIASDDPRALDDFERLLQALTSNSLSGQEFTVFYLKSASAAAVAEVLSTVLGATSSSTGSSALSEIASEALGDVGGGIMGSLLGLSGGSGGGTIYGGAGLLIVPVARLNALIVQATANDLDTIQRLIEVLDDEDLPDTEVFPRPRLIPVVNTSATAIAEVIRDVYSDRLNNARGGQQRGPSPEDIVRALRGGGGRGGGGGGNGGEEDLPKMSIGVDERTNSLVVVAPEPLFREVEELVQTLDLAATSEENSQVARVVTLKRTNSAAVQAALAAILGQPVGTSSTTNNASNNNNNNSSPGRGPGDNNDVAEQMRRRAEILENLRRGGGGPPGFPGGGPPGFGRGGSPFGGGDRGGERGGGDRGGERGRGR
ncbi:Hypothetical protein PBC10988_40030 [Planctomycetales bacterium 10988]|nr:Hypothetical protein PBC10988_40030 [Planctomycetales bacterium 10988]